MAASIDPAQPIPLYFQLKTLLLEQILEGRYDGDGGKLPTEHELCEQFAISRTPVTRALSELAEEGVILRHRRRGTFVNPHWMRRPVDRRELRVVVSEGPWGTMIRDAAAEYGWDIDLGAVAKIWRGGCIIRAAFLDRIRAAHAANPGLVSLLAEEHFAGEIADAQVPWREVVASAARRGIPAPAFTAALAYYDTLRSERLPAALIQSQRDFFGAHTYQRVDREGAFHTQWAEPGRPEVEG